MSSGPDELLPGSNAVRVHGLPSDRHVLPAVADALPGHRYAVSGPGADRVPADALPAGADHVPGPADSVPTDALCDWRDHLLPADGVRGEVHAMSAGYFGLPVRVYAVPSGSDRMSADRDGVHRRSDAVRAHGLSDGADDLSVHRDAVSGRHANLPAGDNVPDDSDGVSEPADAVPGGSDAVPDDGLPDRVHTMSG